MDYVVTGGAGFIGSHLVEALVEQNHTVTVIDNLSSGLFDNMPLDDRVKFVKHDLATSWPDEVPNFFDGAFHLAADARIQPTIKKPRDAINNNIGATAQILEHLRQCPSFCKKIVYSASSSTYGLKNKSPLREDMTPDPLNPYAVTKLVGEQLCQTWGKCYGIGNVSLKYFNVYGERSPVHLGSYSPVIGLFFEQALSGKPITIVGDGEQRRDFTYVADVVNANIAAMEDLHGRGNASGETINIGTGVNYSVNEIAHKIKRIVEPYRRSPVKIEHVNARPAEARETLACIDKAKELLDWSPAVSLDKALESLVFHYLGPWDVYMPIKVEA